MVGVLYGHADISVLVDWLCRYHGGFYDEMNTLFALHVT